MKKLTPQIILPTNHYDLLRERLANLRQFLTEELASRNYSDLYASDLKSEIKILERQLKGRL